MSGNFPSKILIIDGDESVGQGLKIPLERHQIQVDLATDRESAFYLFNQNSYPVVIIELGFEEIPALVLIQKWREHEVEDKRRTGFIVTAGNRNDREPEEAKLIEELDDINLIYKPFTAIQLLPYLQRAIHARTSNQKFVEVAGTVKVLGRNRDKLEKALQLVQDQLKDFGLKGVNLMRELYENHEMWENALSLIDQHLRNHPDHIGLLNSKGRLLLKQGRLDEALECMEIADEKAPNNIERINSLAVAYLKTNQPDRSVDKMKQLIDYHPEDSGMKFDLFAKLYEHGFDEHAQKLCKETSNPLEVVRHYNNKGVALAKIGKVEEAIQEYEHSLQFYPKFKENYRIYYNIALAHLNFKTRPHFEEALNNLNKCLELNKRFEKAKRIQELVSKKLDTKKNQNTKVS